MLFIRPAREFQVCFLDVGQGDGIYIQTKEGADFFIDGGSTSESKVGQYRILSFLKYKGVADIEGWFVSHADTDHISGLLEIWESGYDIEVLFLAEKAPKDEKREELCAVAKEHGTEIVYLTAGDKTGTKSMQIECLAPWREEQDKNEASMVLKLTYFEESTQTDFVGIFAGDISVKQERALLEKYPDLKADLYKASHHGSDRSNSMELLQQLSPAVTVISCSEDNSYGHPGKEAIERIEEAGSKIFYTMKSGQITIGYRSGQIWVRTYK